MILYPNDAPFSTTVIPRGADRFLTQAEVDAANLLYPVPPYGATYVPPDGPPEPPATQGLFVKLSDIQSQDNITVAHVANAAQFAVMHPNLIFVLWPIAGVLGIVDDVGARPVRVMEVNPVDNLVHFNYDSSGLDLTGLVLLGFVYTQDD